MLKGRLDSLLISIELIEVIVDGGPQRNRRDFEARVAKVFVNHGKIYIIMRRTSILGATILSPTKASEFSPRKLVSVNAYSC